MDVMKRFKALDKAQTSGYTRKLQRYRDYVRKRVSKTSYITGAEPENVSRKIMRSGLITKDKVALVSTVYHRYFKYQLDSHTAIDVCESDYELIFTDEPKPKKNKEVYDRLYNERFSFLANYAISSYIQDVEKLLQAPDIDPYKDVDETTKKLLVLAKTYMTQTENAVRSRTRDYDDYTQELQKTVSEFANTIPKNDLEQHEYSYVPGKSPVENYEERAYKKTTKEDSDKGSLQA